MPVKKITKKITTTKKAVGKTKNSALDIPIYSLDGEVSKHIELPKEIFAVKMQPQIIAQYVHAHQTNQRQGTASAKTRSEVTGSTKKIYKQKGTGRARHGSSKAPIFVGGGVVGGPKPRDYNLKINKKQKRSALLMSLSAKQNDHTIYGLSFSEDTMKPKTKIVTGFLKKIKADLKNILFVLPKLDNNNFILSVRNIKGVDLTEVKSLNAYQVLKAKNIIFTDNSLEVMQKHFNV